MGLCSGEPGSRLEHVFDFWSDEEQLLTDGDMTAPDVIPEWRLVSPPLQEPVCACSGEPESEPEWAVPGVTWNRSAARAVTPSPAVVALQEAAARVAQVDPTRLSPEQALLDGEALLQVGQLLRVHEVRRLGDVRTRELYALAGHRSTSSWLRVQQPDGDPALASLAGRLSAYRLLEESVLAGRCSLGAARKVALALTRCRPHVDQPDGLIDEQSGEQVVGAVVRHVVGLVAGCLLGFTETDPAYAALVEATERIASCGSSQLDRLEAAFTLLAEQVPASLLASCLEDLVLAVLPSVLEDRGERGRDCAGLMLEQKRDGSGWRLEGDLDLECGERLFTALAAEVRRDDDAPADTAAAQQLRDAGLDPYDPAAAEQSDRRWPRSRRRVLHDALGGLLDRYLSAGLGGTVHKHSVQVSVTVPAETLDNRPGALPATADSGTRIPRAMLRRWWCDSTITAYILGRTGQALRVVHGGRTLTALERRAALIEHRGWCAGDGCCRGGPSPGRDLRPHHVRRWADDGRTSLDETILICDVLHRDLHEGRRTVRLRDGRHISEQGWVGQASH